jgi:hypothetical protein
MITFEQSLVLNCFEHSTDRNADGTPTRCRRNGKTKTWFTRPGLFRIPVKCGLKHCFYITPANAAQWYEAGTVPPPT